MAVFALATAGVVAFAFSRATAIEAAYPVERARLSLRDRVVSRVRGCFRGMETAAENVRLRREVASLAMVRGDCERLEMENDRLRAALEYTRRAKGRWLAARVLSENGGAAGARRTIRVDRGSLSGIAPGAVVAAPEGLVGKVVYVTPHTSEVLLVADPSLKVSCVVEGPRGVKGILSGGTDDMLVLRHFTVGVEVPPKSRVFTSGLGGVFPGGIPVGTLLDVRRDAGELASEGDVLPAVDFSMLEDVFIRDEK